MKQLVGLVLALLMFATVPALAADIKLGYVDLQKALNESAAGKAAKEKIAAKVKEYQSTIESRQQELKKLKDDLEKQSLLLSEEARAAKERDYQQKLKEFQRFTKDIQDELQQKDADYTKEILQQLFQVIKQLGEKEGYTLVLEKGESSILYADEKINVTEKVIKTFDAQSKKENGK